MNRFVRSGRTYVPTHSVPYLILFATLVLTIVAAMFTNQTTYVKDQYRFENRIEQTADSIQARLDLYISTLRGVSGLLATNPNLTRSEFHAYVQQLNLGQNYPGIQGIGYSARVPTDQLDQFVETIRREDLPDFHIWPEYSREEYHSIVYLEPLDQRNREALGFDMFSETIRRAAMEQARDMGLPTASERVTLVQEIDEHKQAGFLIYVPVYRDGTIPPTTEERRAKLVGFAYSPFRADDLLEGIFGSQTSPRIAFELYDGTPTPDNLLHASRHVDHDSYQPQFTDIRTLEVAEHNWTLRIESQPAFDIAGTPLLVPSVLFVGFAISLVLFAVSSAQANAQIRAQTAVRERDVFLSVASHELKTPLTVLLGNTQLLKRRATRLTMPERDQRSLDVIHEQSRRLNRLIDTLLDNSRIQAGRFTINHNLLDLNILTRRTIDETLPTLTHHTITLNAPDTPIMVMGDELRLEQVLRNLIGNAIKYSPQGGPVTVDLEAHDTRTIIRVGDRGLGIPAHALPRVFEQFYRAPNINTQNISGMGIGLYLIKEIIALHDGTVTVESREGYGSTFTVILPTVPPIHSRELAAERVVYAQVEK